ncbi:hypothetical protein [Flavilitoribacter nigricans]|uniref:Uncharacterized protein n=1 Tax=Flavilitoribacter nigricans (strain ATCC 23147 / DSM 23189 / NBRC 102662 / NCIMB 1420 / SS-2) TaxID=1122177 RepID=A0A2D0N4M6_FLAN2|nr:hypothetical protein [Flavilitoribacter nigricans]PHN03471.1 hypothetical protein CRP01_26060 [Flavilitoribacter nigricans DSM 23189 = NBRC 102662]
MELAELQSAWNLVNVDVQRKDILDEQAVRTRIRRSSGTELAGIKRALQFKFLIGTTVAVIAIGASLGSALAPREFHPLDFLFSARETTLFYGTLSVSLCCMLFFNHRAYRFIGALERSTEDVKTSLERFIQVMERAMRFNIYSDTFMSPVFFTWFYYAYAFREHDLDWDIRGLLLVLLPVLVGVFSFFFQKYMQHLKFGRYLDRLKYYLQSLDAKKED